jgi:hypothetical protein
MSKKATIPMTHGQAGVTGVAQAQQLFTMLAHSGKTSLQKRFFIYP